MRCDCCGKRKCFLESYEDIVFEDRKLHICVKCSTLIYKYRDAVEAKLETRESLKSEIESRMKPNSYQFKKWFDYKFR